jgi:hypothetical protein
VSSTGAARVGTFGGRARRAGDKVITRRVAEGLADSGAGIRCGSILDAVRRIGAVRSQELSDIDVYDVAQHRGCGRHWRGFLDGDHQCAIDVGVVDNPHLRAAQPGQEVIGGHDSGGHA